MEPRQAEIGALAAELAGARLDGPVTERVSGICYDSRLVEPGDLFVALPGADFDGHQFVASAEARGARALLVEHRADSTLPQIIVNDSREALAQVSATFYGHPSRDIGVIGITGTDGKTTTSYITDHLLRCAGNRTGMIGTVAIRIGDHEDRHASRQTTPESSDVQRYLRQMTESAADWCTLEATSHGLAMHRLDHVAFRIGAVTNITHEHLDFHGSLREYRRAKARLLERVAAGGGTVVLNADDEGARSIEPYARGAEIVRFSTLGDVADLRATDYVSDASGSEFTLDAGSVGCTRVKLPMLGSFNVANALCAAGVAMAAGIEFRSVASALESAPSAPGRMARVDEGQPFSVVVDYAHTPDSLGKVLQLLRDLHPAGRLVAVFGSAGERDVEKRPLQGGVSARLADVTVVTSEDPRQEDPEAIVAQICEGAKASGAVPGSSLFAEVDRREAIRLALELARPGDCVLLAGKGHEGSIIWGREKLPWDEELVARELLTELGYSGG